MRGLKQYRSSIQDLLNAVYYCDENGYLTLFNKASEELWGRKPEIGKEKFCGSCNLYDAQGNKLEGNRHPVVQSIRDKSSIDSLSLLVERPDGSRRNVLFACTPLFDVGGAYKGTINIMVDITECKEQ